MDLAKLIKFIVLSNNSILERSRQRFGLRHMGPILISSQPEHSSTFWCKTAVCIFNYTPQQRPNTTSSCIWLQQNYGVPKTWLSFCTVLPRSSWQKSVCGDEAAIEHEDSIDRQITDPRLSCRSASHPQPQRAPEYSRFIRWSSERQEAASRSNESSHVVLPEKFWHLLSTGSAGQEQDLLTASENQLVPQSPGCYNTNPHPNNNDLWKRNQKRFGVVEASRYNRRCCGWPKVPLLSSSDTQKSCIKARNLFIFQSLHAVMRVYEDTHYN